MEIISADVIKKSIVSALKRVYQVYQAYKEHQKNIEAVDDFMLCARSIHSHTILKQ